ncbi:MAG: fumarylacetoacetate hydrolase family protein [Betaproteobacteria bacterium]|nr:fumarylacetoacetate hydrolase family protein [Betaproteobacteria bacterium]
MKFVSYSAPGGPGWGLLTSRGVVPSAQLGAAAPATLQGAIEALVQAPTLAHAFAERAVGQPALPLAGLKLLPVLPRPGKIVCLGVNYHDHAKEGGNAVADYPALFLRCATSLLAHGAPLRVPATSGKLDFEAELALVIGAPARHVAEADALRHVFGYACFNDATLRDYQRKTTQWTIGKNFDSTGGFGPCLVTADELPPGCTGLHIESRLNGRVMQSATTSDMVFGVARTIALLSEAMTLETGDVVVMGTPAGVGYARTPPVWMQAGDTIEIQIECVGLLSNPVTA